MDDRIDGVVITFIDISSRKEAEQQLKEAKQAAETATTIKDEFLATLSHELRTPLSAILLWTRILREKGIASEQLIEGLEVIERSAEAQKTLVDDLLDTSRITAGNFAWSWSTSI
jgi:signal transduction histidine kinase